MQANEGGLAHRKLNSVLNNSGRNGVACQACGVVDVEFGHEMLAVFFHGLNADPQLPGYLLVRFTLRYQLQGFHLSGA